MSTDSQQKLDSSTAKSKLYSELAKQLARTGFHPTTEQITNILKKLKKDYRDINDTKRIYIKVVINLGDFCGGLWSKALCGWYVIGLHNGMKAGCWQAGFSVIGHWAGRYGNRFMITSTLYLAVFKDTVKTHCVAGFTSLKHHLVWVLPSLYSTQFQCIHSSQCMVTPYTMVNTHKHIQ